MLGRKIMIAGLMAAVAIAGLATADVAEAGRKRGLKNLGFKVYWHLLDQDQKQEAKKLIVENLFETAIDRWRCAARIIEYRADVAEVFTPEQRVKLGKMRFVIRHLPDFKKRALITKFLDRTDRELMADRIESLAGAGPEERVETGYLIHDQLHGALLEALRKRIEITEEQERRLGALYSDLKDDLKPAAIRLESARQETARKGLDLLTEDQRTKLEKVMKVVSDKVLAFIRG